MLSSGHIHEWHLTDCLNQRNLWFPPLTLLMLLACSHTHERIVWIGRRCWPTFQLLWAHALLMVTERAKQEIVSRCCPLPRRATGIFPRMTLAEARALGQCQVAPFDAAKIRQALELLVNWGLRFSPVVSMDPDAFRGFHLDECPDGILLNVTGASHLFGGEHLLLTEIRTRLHRIGIDCRLAVAPTIGSSWAISRFGPHTAAVVHEEQVVAALSRLPVVSCDYRSNSARSWARSLLSKSNTC